ncbi:MAG: HAD-IA family hydrolase [Candidatus Aenigmarchaeota archaeon]|nr:HAD-IA family hydrolase [Candidatus Aenigmarchaeota archaeon]
MLGFFRKRSSEKRVVIFDFDGTIADTMDETVAIFNRLAEENGYRKITAKEIKILRGEDLERVVRRMKISIFVLPFLVSKARKMMGEDMGRLKATVGVRGALLKIKKMGFKIGILTLNSKDNVRIFLRNNDLDIFDFVYAGGSIFGKHKMLKRALREIKMRPDEAVYVGDEVRDINAARRRKVSIISVTWGYNNEAALRRRGTDYIVRTPAQLVSVVRGMKKTKK